jgi:hypothetical protein
MTQMKKCIHKYEKQGRAIINALKDRGALEGWYRTLSDLYPDNAHFVFELLQNSEDANATKVEFKLSDNSLIFLHNGTRAFSEDDINSITNIGNSNKSINKIGKFGVGFKSVFTYTDTPKIHSKNISFQIQNLIVPSLIDGEEIDYGYTTLFEFPFNRKNKDKEIACKEISNLFNELSDNVLLFLDSVSEIIWNLEDGSRFSILKRKNQNITEIINSSKGSSYWLIFNKISTIDSKKFNTSIAYSYNKKEKKINRIKGDVSIFFPAKKEFSGLGFHINAPFSSTVARDSITDANENKELLFSISDLCAESIHSIKNLNLLNMSFFEVLPSEDDELSSFYKPVYNRFLQEFNDENNKLIPLEDGSLSNLDSCIYSSRLFKDTFIDKDLRVIFNSDLIIGIAKSPLKNSRADKFISKLKCDYVDDSYIHEKLQEFSDRVSQHNLDYYCESDLDKCTIEIGREWLNSKTNEQIQAIYSFIYESREYDDYISTDFLSIIKLSNGEFNFSKEDMYFFEGNSLRSDFLFSEPLTYSSGKNQKQQKQSMKFHELLNVKELDDAVYLTLFFENYKFKSVEGHLKDINKLVDFYIASERNIDWRFGFFKFIYTSDELLARPSDVCIDSPYLDTGMNGVAKILRLYKLNNIYTGLDNKEEFLNLLIAIDAKDKLKVERCAISSSHPERVGLVYSAKGKRYTPTGVNSDWSIDSIDTLLEEASTNIATSVLIWNAVNNAGVEVFNAIYRNNSSHPEKIGKSYLIHALSRESWIYNDLGVAQNPKDVDNESLNKIYDKDKNEWLKEIGFGENIYKETKDFDQKNEVLSEFNLDYGIASEIKKFSPEEVKEFVNIVKSKRQNQKLSDILKKERIEEDEPEFIEVDIDKSIIIDKVEYQKQVTSENKLNDSSFSTTSSSILKQDSSNIQLIKFFLYEQYDGHCQICGDTFAYREKNFFTDFSLNRGKDRDINRKGNTLCLCPKHHQIFTLGIQDNIYASNMPKYIDTDIMKDLFLYKDCVGSDDMDNKNDGFYMSPNNSFEIDSSYMMPIKLFKEIFYIKFTEAHAIEFADTWNHF